MAPQECRPRAALVCPLKQPQGKTQRANAMDVLLIGSERCGNSQLFLGCLQLIIPKTDRLINAPCWLKGGHSVETVGLEPSMA
jgi:hypothetical protein